MKQNSLKGWFKSGAPGVWISGGAVSIAVIMTIGLLAVITVRGLGHFWPADLVHANYNVPGMPEHLVVGEVVQKEEVPRERLKSAGLPVPDEGPEFMTRELIKVGNRDLNGTDFTWIVGEWLTNQTTPPELMAIERREWGNFYGYLVNVKEDGKVIAEGEAAWPQLQARVQRVNQLAAELKTLEKKSTSVQSTLAWSASACTVASWSWTASSMPPPKPTWKVSAPNSMPVTRTSKRACPTCMHNSTATA
nr:hypothetical protein GCM10020185_31180 [Pseudomonas brassicacearum subsp. brassicacearum]